MSLAPADTLVPASLVQRLLHAQRLRDHDARDPFVEVFTFTSGYPWTAADLKEAFIRWVLTWPMMRAVFLETPEGLRLDFPPIDEARVVRVASVTHLPNLDRRRATDALIDEFASAPIDLTLGPLAQVLIVETGGGETRCAIRASRLTVDLTMLSHIRESYLRACYEVGGGRPRHHAEVDRAALAADLARDDAAHDAAQARGAAFWAAYLPDERVPMTLPTRVGAGALRYHERRGDWALVRLQPAVVNAARALAEKHEVTLGDVLEACFVALLTRYSDAETIVLREYTAHDSEMGAGMPVAHGQLLPLVFEVTPTTPFSTLIDQVTLQRQRVREGAANLRFDAVVPLADHTRDKIDLLTQAGFRYMRYVSPDGEARPQIGDFAMHQRFRPPVDLLLSVDDFSDNVLVSLTYCLDLFDPRVIDDVGAHYASLLLGFVHAAQQPLGMPRMLSDEEEHRIVHDWNQTAVPYPHDRSLADLVFHTCETHSDRVATVDAHRSLTYRQLGARAEALAAHLAELGARRGDHVVLLQDRSVDVITAIVACVSAGLAYVPLEPDYPKARVEALCAQCGAMAVVADPALAGLAPEGIPVITDLDMPHERFGRIHRPISQPTDIAYVLFTSGSTGVPKAAQVTQRGVVNLVTWLIGEFGFDERDRVMLKTPYSHDISVPEIFIPLLTGGCVVVAEPGGHRDPMVLRNLVNSQGVTVMHFVPTMLAEFVRGLGPDELPTLRTVFAGGEPLVVDLAQHIRVTYPWRLINVYGPTECTDYATWWPVQPDAAAISPIGKPIGNTRCYVLGPTNDLKPVGVAGELCISGDGVGMGYLGNAEKTAATFVQNPFEPGRVMYRSGDICRWRPDGTLEFIRRDDGQVKVRGHRIELGEIEARLCDHPQVHQAVVVVRADRADVKQLVAYVQIDGACTRSDLRAWCQQSLAEYMVPSVFVRVDAFALTLSGKIDRKKLPAPPERDEETTIVAPRTPTQARVQKLWTEVLGLAQLSVETPLVEAGMDSIMAIRVCAKLRAMGYAVSVATLFAYPTVAALADALDAQQPAPAAPRAATAPPSAAPASMDRAPLTEVQQAMIATSELHPDGGTYIEQIVYLVDDDVTETVISRFHACLSAQPLGQLTVVEMAGQWAFVTAPQPAPAPAFIDGADAQALGAFLAADRARGFTLSQAPLWRLSAVGIGGGRRCIVWTHHHVLLDGWSLLALQAEMLRSAAGEAPRPLGNGLSDLAAFQAALKGWTESHTREAEAFWTRTLEGVEITEPLQVSATPPVADIEGETDTGLSSGALTLDRVYGLAAREGVRVDRVTVAVEKRALAALCTLANVTPSTVLRSAWGRVYAHHVNRSDVLLGVTSSGRSLPMDGLESFVGCTLVTFPVRMKLDPEQPITEWLQASHAAALEAMEWEHLSFARIAELATGGTSARLLHHIFVYEDGYGLDTPATHPVTPLGSIDQTDYPLIVQVDATHDPVEVHFSFDPSRYTRDQVASVARRFRMVLDQMVRSPHARLADIELVSATEKRRLLAEQPVQVDLGPLNVPARIDRVIASTPDAPALCFEGELISYGTLDTAVEAIRARLQDAGVREGQAVALIMPRSPLVIASILAIWRIGAHYVPLDPALPTLPATQMLVDAAPAAVLTAGDVPDLQAKTAGQCHISLPALASLLSPPPPRRDRPRLSGDLDALAYVLYTSGSTGAPKGVMQTHHTLLNMGVWMAREMRIDASDRMVYKTPYTFDVSLPDMFYALCVGGTVVIARDGMHADPDYLIDLVNATQATIIQFVPSMLDVFMTSGGLEKTPSLRWVMAAGERLTLTQVRTFQRIKGEHALGVALRNLYGPTETFYITDVQITDDDAGRDSDPPIGTVFPNNAAYVLDRLGALCGTGVSGELVIAGNHVARGYLRRPELTAARFIADPFSHRVNRGESAIARAYRTGDTCFWGSDHQLHYLGRSDDQVKINGVRIELGAVVAALTQIRGVHRAAVTPSDEKPPVLLAFVQAESGTLDAEQVRAECTRRLPPAAVPAHVMVVDTFPMTRHGKVDLAQLRARAREQRAGAVAETGFRAPSGELEERVADLLRQIRPEIAALSATASIFDSGYTSLDAVRLAVGLRRAGHPLEVADCYALGSIAAIAARLGGEAVPEVARGGGMVSHGLDWAAFVRRAVTHLETFEPRSRTTPDPSWTFLDAGTAVITGASGFLGRHLAAGLLRQGRRVLLLGRDLGGRAAAALQRVDAGLDVAGAVASGRLRMADVDLNAPGLSLSPELTRWLSTSSGPVIHAAALVHHLFPYERLERENVLAVAELVKLLASRGRGRLVFVSTVATALGQALDADGYAVSSHPPPFGGYVESKWVAEHVVQAAHAAGQDAIVVRPPRLYASPASGAYNERDALMRLLLGCIDAGVVPDRIGSEPLVTIDDAVGALWDRATDTAAPAASQLPWVDVEVGDLFAEIRSQGVSLEALPVDAWRERILALEGNAAIPVLSDFGLGPGETPATVDYTAVAPALDDDTAKAMREQILTATRVFAANARSGGV